MKKKSTILRVVTEFELSDEELLRAARVAINYLYPTESDGVYCPDKNNPDLEVFLQLERAIHGHQTVYDVVLQLLNQRLEEER
jgi:hypothetical protein